MIRRIAFAFLSLALFSTVSVASAASIAPGQAPAPSGQVVNAPLLYGLTASGRIVGFRSNAPGTVLSSVALVGLAPGERMLGIDVRPATNQIFAVSNASQFYVIDPVAGAVNRVGAVLSPAIEGSVIGFDFNPAADRVRIVTSSGQNLRVVPDTGAVTVDGVLNPGAPRIVAAAYTNSFAGTATTTLYVVDAASGMLMTQGSVNGAPVSPNSGTLLPVGPLGFQPSDSMAFDISLNGIGYLVNSPAGGISNFYTVDLRTGRASLVGPLAEAMTGLTVAPQVAGSLDLVAILRSFGTLPR